MQRLLPRAPGDQPHVPCHQAAIGPPIARQEPTTAAWCEAAVSAVWPLPTATNVR